MKIVSISDTHEFQKDLKIPDADILIHCGDFSLAASIDALIDFKNWLTTLPHKYKIVIAGNHDRYRNEILRKAITDAYYLENDSIEIEGLKYWGSPFTPSFANMRTGLSFYRKPGKQMAKIWKQIPDDADILITHGPPQGILDRVMKGPDIGAHVGDGMLAAILPKLKNTKLHMFGHIHEGYGILQVRGGKTFINCSVVNEDYNLINKPIITEFENAKEFKRGNFKVYYE
ncbi:MAG TPA: metallophosphoesterase [bacterium]|nr:metallophosphoesterase [bacterium]